MDKLAILGGAPVRTDPWPSWPVWDESEEEGLLEVLRSGNWWRYSYGQGSSLEEDLETSPSKVAQFQRAFAHAHDCQFGICTANGTVSLEIALRAAGVRPGDEVIVPAYTFIATATSVLMVGAIPIFVDIEGDTYNMDPLRLAEAITPRTRAVVPVHFGGQPCSMESIRDLAKKHGLKVIEDAAHAHGSSYKGKKCGSLGDLGSFSFQASKNMTAGEGGIITTNDQAYAEAADMLVWAGRKIGQPWYQHYILAGNARMTEFQGALLLSQLGRLEELSRRRSENARLLDETLIQIEGIRPTLLRPETTRHSYHLYMFRYDAKAFAGLPKERFTAALQAEGIGGASGGYMHPLYANPMFVEKNFFGGAYPVDAFEHGRAIHYADFIERCPVSERACASEAVWLPQNMLLADEKAMRDVGEAIRKVQQQARMLV